MRLERTLSLDPHAIDLMGYLYSEGKVCPICGKRKRPRQWLCDNCFFVWGEEAIRQIKMEVGRRNLGAWDLLVGPNLKGALRSQRNISLTSETTIPNNWGVSVQEPEPSDYFCRIIKPTNPQIVDRIKESKESGVENRRISEFVPQPEKSLEEKIELAPHTEIYAIKSVVAEMAQGDFPKVFVCPFCGKLKRESWWMCSDCTAHQWGQKISLLKWHISQINPQASFIRWQLLTLEQESTVLRIAVEFLKKEDSHIFIRWPGRFPTVVEAMAIDRWGTGTKMERFIFAKIAYQAIGLVKWSTQTPATRPLAPVKPAVSKPKDADKLSTIKNFRENPKLAQAFFLFLDQELENWRKGQKEKSLSANQKGFFEKAGISSAFYFDLKNHSQGSLKKAQKVAKALNTTLKKAVCIGLNQTTSNQ